MRKFLYILALLLLYGSSLSGHRAIQAPPVTAQRTSTNDSSEIHALSAVLTNEFDTTASDHFLLVHTGDAQKAKLMCSLLESAYARFISILSSAGFEPGYSGQRFVWVCFDDRDDFDDYAAQADGTSLPALDAYYSTRTNRVAVVQYDSLCRQAVEEPAVPYSQSSPAVLASVGDADWPSEGSQADVTRFTHELAHQFVFNTGLQKRGVMYPLWASEGFATFFESALSGAPLLGDETAARSQRLLKLHHQQKLVGLDIFVLQTRLPRDLGLQKDFYAQTWGLFYFLYSRRNADLKKYFSEIYTLDAGRRDEQMLHDEFINAFGSMDRLTCQWSQFLDQMSLRQ
jgi:hypothetical protein